MIDKRIDLVWIAPFQITLFEGQISCPFWRTNIFEGQISCPFDGQRYWPFRGTNQLPFLRDKSVTLFQRQTGCPFWGTNKFSILMEYPVYRCDYNSSVCPSNWSYSLLYSSFVDYLTTWPFCPWKCSILHNYISGLRWTFCTKYIIICIKVPIAKSQMPRTFF